jgi:hypothetical protein
MHTHTHTRMNRHSYNRHLEYSLRSFAGKYCTRGSRFVRSVIGRQSEALIVIPCRTQVTGAHVLPSQSGQLRQALASSVRRIDYLAVPSRDTLLLSDMHAFADRSRFLFTLFRQSCRRLEPCPAMPQRSRKRKSRTA